MKGHQITASYNEFPDFRQDHCDKCGAPTIYKCPKCSVEIRGHYISSGAISGASVPVPDHCHNCGAPYPWTETKIDKLVSDILVSTTQGKSLDLTPTFEKLGLSKSWEVASSALAAFEVMVNRKLEQMKLSTDGDYDKRISRLADALKNKGIPFDAIMISSFRTARVKVLHGGKDPTETELGDIIKYLKTATNTLFP